MEEISLVRDFAIIMVVAGAVTLLFRQLRQPLVLGYLLAGFLLGPHTLPVPLVTDVHTISLLADLGLVLLLFGIGLEFSWSKIREIGMSVLVIGGIEITTMIVLGYSLGRLLGWSTTDAIFLGAALHISSSAIIVKMLRDTHKLQHIFSRLIIGILVVEDFAAIIIIAILSGVATTGIADVGDAGFLVLKLFIFVVVSLVLGTIIVPKIISFTHRFHSKEALLVTSLGLCFAMALFSNYLGLSVAIGAFLIGSIIGDTEQAEEVIEVLTPVRIMFAAFFFVAIGMLIDVTGFTDVVPAVIVALVFIAGKVLGNTTATFLTGRDGKTSLQVGMGMPQMGEFSLVITKIGLDRNVIMPQLYPIITFATAITTLTTPYIMRSTNSVINFFDRSSPALLKAYIGRLSDWLQALRSTFARDSVSALIVQHAIKRIMVNLLIVVVLITLGTFSLRYAENLAGLSDIRIDVMGLIFGFLLIMLCLPSFYIIWKNIRNVVHEAVGHLLKRRLSARTWGHKALHIVLRDSIVIMLTVLVGMWFIPFISGLISIGSFALLMPLLLAAFVIFLVLRFAFNIHSQLEHTFSRTLVGEGHLSATAGSTVIHLYRELGGNIARCVRSVFVKTGGSRDGSKSKKQKSVEAPGQTVDGPAETDDKAG